MCKINKDLNWSVVASVFGSSVENKLFAEDYRSPSRLKREIKEYVNSISQSEVMAQYEPSLLALQNASRDLLVELQNDLVGVNLDAVELPETINRKTATTEAIADYDYSMALYNLVVKVGLLDRRIKTIDLLVDGGKKSLRKSLIALVSKYINAGKKEAIINIAISAVSRSIKGELDMALDVIEVLYVLGFVKALRTAQTKDGRLEFIYMMNVPDSLFATNMQTSNRSLKFLVPEVKETLVNRKDYAYEQSSEPIEDVVRSMNSVAISFKDNVDKSVVKELVDGMIINEYGLSLYDEEWKYYLMEDMNNELELARKAGSFYINRTTDSVGRLYEQSKYGFHMGSAFKSVLELANKEILTENGKAAYRQWYVNEHLGVKHADGTKFTEDEAEKYFNEEVYAGSYESIKEYLSDEPTGMLIECDAQTQGASLYGALTGDRNLCYNTALIGNKERTDLYRDLALFLNTAFGVDVWTRASVKYALMTKGYGAKAKTIMVGSDKNCWINWETEEYFISEKARKHRKVVPLMLTAEKAGITDIHAVWKAFDKAMNLLVPRMLEIQAYISMIQKMITKATGNPVISWVMPDGLECSIAPVKNVEKHLFWIDHHGKTHQVTHHVKELVKDNTTALAPRIIQSVDAFVLRQVERKLRAQGIELVAIHDGYMVHPNHAKALQLAYREVIADILEMDLLTDIISQIVGDRIDSLKTGDVTKEEILDSKYALWY